jgi:hypothetical protein
MTMVRSITSQPTSFSRLRACEGEISWSTRRSVLDRAPILFGARRDFAQVGGDAVAVRAVEAVELLDQVEVGQVLAVEDDVVGALHPGDAVDREADPLVQGDEQVHQQEGNPAGVDHRCGERHQQPRTDQEAQQADLVAPLLAQEFVGQFGAPAQEVLAVLAVVFLDLFLQGLDAFEQFVELLSHG